MTPADVITEVRRIVQDEKAPYRYSDAMLLGYVNQTLRRMVVLRPDLFSEVVDVATTPDVVEQTLPSSAVRLVEIFRVRGGNAIEEVDRDQFDRAYPQWPSDPAGAPTKYMRHPRNPRAYFLYPRPQSGVVLVGEYVETPPNYAVSDTIAALPDAYLSTLVDGTVYLVESMDDEHINSGRAKLFLDSFVEALGTSLRARAVLDTEAGPPPAVEGQR